MDEMDHRKNRMQLVAKLRRIRNQNQQLTSMIKLMHSNYNTLLIKLTQQHQEERRRSSPNSTAKALKLDIDIAGDCNLEKGRLQRMDRRLHDDGQLRKINYVPEQSTDENANSSVDEDSPSKQVHLPNNESSYPAHVAAPKKIVTVRRKSDANTVSDGCRWRKYGQKITRNSPWPRAYYRCGITPSCPVKRQVQKCAQDPSVVITTYQGEHNHVLSPVAMAAMNVGSDQLHHSSSTEDNQVSLPFRIAAISYWGSFPTITLDLTDISQPNTIPMLGFQGVHPQLVENSSLQLPDSVAFVKADAELAATTDGRSREA